MFRVVAFYLGPIVLLILVSGLALSPGVAKYYWMLMIVSAIMTLIVTCGAGHLVRSTTENTSAIEERLAETKNSE